MLQDLSEVAERVQLSTVQVEESGRGAGSGVIWRADGAVVTNAHVVRRAGGRIRLWDGRVARASLVARDPQLDLALLQADATGFPAASAGDSDALRVGELVLAVGSPYGHAGALTVGVVHAAANRRRIEADLRLAPGNSGGPLADAEGRVIGINTMVVHGVALAIPSNAVERFVARGGRPSPRLGVTVKPVADAQGFGLLIVEIEAGGPAGLAGLQVGDILTSVDGQPFQAPFDLAYALEAADALLRLDLRRGGRVITREVNLALSPVGARVG
jgi:serine protease Do